MRVNSDNYAVEYQEQLVSHQTLSFLLFFFFFFFLILQSSFSAPSSRHSEPPLQELGTSSLAAVLNEDKLIQVEQ